MKTIDVIMVRVYVTESSHLLKRVTDYLSKEAKIRGVSVFRAISGVGESGAHMASLMDLSLDLPLAIEFFDTEDKIKIAIDHLSQMIKAEHIVFWKAQVNG